MAFPVDILATVDPESLEQSAKDYTSKLAHRNLEIHEYLSIPGSDKIEVGLCNVSFVPLYGVDIKQKVLALFSPEDPFKAVGLYLLDQWWSAEDILKTADSSRTGLIEVRTPGERIVLYVLNRIVYRTKEMAGDDAPFLCHGEDEIAKILWKNGEAVGFYSVKPEGKLCNDFLTQRYQLPVMDTIFIRKCHRGNGHGLQLLKDFVDSFENVVLGLKHPLSPAMYKVCKKYLSLYPEHTELLWEVYDVGSHFQRTLIARKLKAMDLKEDSDVPMEVGVTQVRETMECTEEEVVQIKITEEVKNMAVTTRGGSSSLKRKKLGVGTEETAEKIIRVEDTDSDVQCAGDELACKDSTLSFNSKEPELKETIETMTCDVTPILEFTHLHCEAQNKLTREPICQSETERVTDINPVMELESLKRIEDAQILQTFKATIAPVDLHPLELQQEVEVEIVKMSSETEEVKEKAVEIRVFKDGVNREIPSDGWKQSEAIVKTEKDRTDMAETFNKEDTEDGEAMGKMSVIKNIVEEIEVIKVQAGALSVQCETSHDDKEKKDNILIQQEENLAYGSGSKGKQGDERKSRHSRRLVDKAAEGEQTERVLSFSKKTFKATCKQVDDETTGKGLNQTESQAALTEKEQEIAEIENVRGKIKSTSIMCVVSNDNKEEINIEKDYLDNQTTDDLNLMDVENKRKDSSKDENKMDEKFRDEEQKQVTAGVIEVAMTSEDGEEIGIVDVNSTDKSEIVLAGKGPEQSVAEHIEEQEEELALERVPAEDDINTQVALKRQRVALTFGAPTEKQQVVEMADHENVDILRDRIKNRIIEVTEVRLDKTEMKENTDTNKMEEAQEEEPMNKPKTIKSKEPKISNIEASLDYEVDKTNKDDKETADVNAAGIEVKGQVPEPSTVEPVKEQKEEPTSEMVPAEIAQKTKKANSTLKLQKVAVVLVDSNKVPTMDTHASKDAGRFSQPESTDDVEKKQADGLHQKVKTTEKEQEVEITKKGNVTVEVMDKIQNSSIEEPEEIMETEARVITDIDRVLELTENKNKMNQEEKAVTETTVVQDTPEEEIKSKEIIESDEDGGGVKLDNQIELSEEEQNQTNSVTLRHSRRVKHHTTESELTKRVLRSATKARSQQEKMKQPVDDLEVKQIKDIRESHTDTSVEEKIKSVSITTETGHFKDVEVVFKDKIAEQSAAKTVNEHEEESSAETGPAEDDKTEEATSGLRLENFTVVLVDKIPTTPIDAGEVVETSQSQEKVDVELHKTESTDPGSQTEYTENEQVVKMTENEMKETDENVKNQEGNGNETPESAVTDKRNIEEVQNDTSTAQEIQAEEPRSLHVIESSEEDEGEIPDVIIKLGKDKEDEASLLTPLRWSRRLQDQAAESELTKRVLRRSARLTNKSTPQLIHKQQIKAMMMTEPEQLDESKNDEMNVIVESEVAVGEHVESETVYVFAEVDPGSMFSAVQSVSEEESKKEKEDDDDHTNVKSISVSHGNEVEEKISCEDVTEKEKMAPKKIVHGEAEQICTSGKKSPGDMELSEAVKEVEDEVIEKAHGEDENVMEATSALALQEASVVLVDVKKLPLDEEVLTRHLRWRTVTVTPRRRSKPLTGKHVAKLVMEAHESKVCHDVVEVQSTEKARNVVEETHETNSKRDSEEGSAVSKAATKDLQQDKNIPENKAGKVEEKTDKGGEMVKEAADRKDQDHVEGHQDEHEEIKETDETNREQVRSANTKQYNAQEETFEKRKHLEEGKDKHTINILITEAVLDESEEGVGVERKALRKRTSRAASVRKSKRLRKQDQGDIDGQRGNTEESAPVEATVKDMADVRSHTEKETTDQEIETIGGEMCHKEKKQENVEGEETSGDANNSQENTVIEGTSKQVWLSKMLNVSEDTDIKLVVQEKAKGKEDRKKKLVTEEVTGFENNAGKADKGADEPKEFKDTQKEAEQSEKNAEGMTEGSVTIDKYFTLELDDEINSDDAECNQVVRETKRILRSRKSATACIERKSTRKSRRLQQDGRTEPSETEDKSEAEEVKEVMRDEEKKPQQKRKVGNVDEELTPRSKRLARAEIM